MRRSISLLVLAMTVALNAPTLNAEEKQADHKTPYTAKTIGHSDGVEKVLIKSRYQSGEPELRIMLPNDAKPEDGKTVATRRVLFVLPVEADNGKRWGDSLASIKKHNLHNKHNLIVIAPTFSQLPWYADHPTDQAIQQETHFIKAVLPYVQERFKSKPAQHLLLGFSKSGWGAFTLILRHPKSFRAAAAWDAPLMNQNRKQYGAGPIFGTQENFQSYHVATLIENADASFQKQTRLVLTGYDNFRQHHIDAHTLMDKHHIKHEYKDGPKVKHHWESGWVPEAVELLVKLR